MKVRWRDQPDDRFDDRGTFTTYYGVEQIGRVRFRCSENGGYVGRSTVEIGGESSHTTLCVETDRRGSWQRLVQESRLATVRTERVGTKVTIASDGEQLTIRVVRRTFLHDPSAPALIGYLVRAYGRRATRPRRFNVLVLPASVTSVVLQRQPKSGHCQRRGDGVELFSYDLPKTRLWVWVDMNGRVLVVSAPTYQSAYVRKGYLGLYREHALKDVPRDQLRAPRVKEGVRVKMRDGISLATTIYLPARAGRQPGIVIRTPYGRAAEDLQARFFARHGYAVAVQDVRGRFASGGEWHPFIHEAHDGFDTIEWMARQPWCTGRVGMMGGSYSALVQWLAAVERPPHLTTIVPLAAPADPFDAIPYDRGVFGVAGAIWWLDITAQKATADLSGATMLQASTRDWSALLKELPVIAVDVRVLGHRDAVWRTWIRHNSFDRYWRKAAFLDRLGRFDIPVFHQAAAFDALTSCTIRNYRRLRAYGFQQQRLVIGPWLHWSESRKVGGRDFGPTAIFDLKRATLRWLDNHLKGAANGVASEPPVHVFVTGLNRWVTAQHYPLSSTRFERWYLHPAGEKQDAGALDRRVPASRTRSSAFTYDPGNPTPEGEPLGFPRKPPSSSLRQLLSRLRGKPAVRPRSDVLTFSSARLSRRRAFVGPVSLRLCAASSAVDTDWHIRLFEIDAGGTAFAIAQGRIRARYRQSYSQPRLLERDEIYDYTIDLGHIGVSLDRGSRLQLVVASAAYPTYSRNLNTGGHNEMEAELVVAHQTIFHNRQHLSYLLLPALPDDALANESAKEPQS